MEGLAGQELPPAEGPAPELEQGPALELEINYRPRAKFAPFHDRAERFACIVTHRRAGKTVACVHELQKQALKCQLERPRFAYLSPFLRQSKAVAWDYLRAAVAPLRRHGATTHESELRVDHRLLRSLRRRSRALRQGDQSAPLCLYRAHRAARRAG
jgi:hypothetical protein